MRHPFYMDRLDPADQRTVKRLYLRTVVVYCWLALFAVTGVALRIVLAPPIDSVQHEGTAYIVRASDLVGTSAAIAAESTDRARCASRDLRLVMSIELHGEAQDVPAETLRAAFFTMAEARAVCAAGRVDEALAIYDTIVIEPASPYRRQDD